MCDSVRQKLGHTIDHIWSKQVKIITCMGDLEGYQIISFEGG